MLLFCNPVEIYVSESESESESESMHGSLRLNDLSRPEERLAEHSSYFINN